MVSWHSFFGRNGTPLPWPRISNVPQRMTSKCLCISPGPFCLSKAGPLAGGILGGNQGSNWPLSQWWPTPNLPRCPPLCHGCGCCNWRQWPWASPRARCPRGGWPKWWCPWPEGQRSPVVSWRRQEKQWPIPRLGLAILGENMKCSSHPQISEAGANN